MKVKMPDGESYTIKTDDYLDSLDEIIDFAGYLMHRITTRPGKPRQDNDDSSISDYQPEDDD